VKISDIEALEREGERLLAEGLARLASAARKGGRVRDGLGFVSAAKQAFKRARAARRGRDPHSRRRRSPRK
jgi:hypothetical protein